VNRTIVPADVPWLTDKGMYLAVVRLAPDVVLDVGANEGQFVTRLRGHGYSGRVVSFEPQAGPFATLQRLAATDPAWECHQLALGEADAVIPMHVSAFSQSSSLLPIGKVHVDLMPFTAELRTEDVQVTRLDEWAAAHDVAGRRVFLKLDVQGYEASVLRGAGDLLRDVVGVVAELNFAPLFDGQSKYHEVLAMLDAAGFRLAWLTAIHTHPETGDYLWADALFRR
jgi:FkbM family methyltransferase